MREQEVRELYEAYMQVHQPQEVVEEVEELDETRTDPRGRPASGPMSVYGGRGTPSPDPEGDDNISRMDRAQRRVKRTQPSAKGRAADSLFTKYSARQRGAGGEEGPGPKAPKRSGRSGRGANTDRGSGNAAKRRMSEDFDIFDTILEHLVAEGYADTNEAALAIMANMSEEWRQSIVEEVFDEALTGERYKKVMNKPGGTAYSRKVSADPSKRATRGGRGGESDFGAGDRGSGNKAARRAGTYKED
jgi:hypothetical protein